VKIRGSEIGFGTWKILYVELGGQWRGREREANGEKKERVVVVKLNLLQLHSNK
jgi:hypothetical protein